MQRYDDALGNTRENINCIMPPLRSQSLRWTAVRIVRMAPSQGNLPGQLCPCVSLLSQPLGPLVSSGSSLMETHQLYVFLPISHSRAPTSCRLSSLVSTRSKTVPDTQHTFNKYLLTEKYFQKELKHIVMLTSELKQMIRVCASVPGGREQ